MLTNPLFRARQVKFEVKIECSIKLYTGIPRYSRGLRSRKLPRISKPRIPKPYSYGNSGVTFRAGLMLPKKYQIILKKTCFREWKYYKFIGIVRKNQLILTV